MAAGGGYGDNLLDTYIDLMQRRVFDPIGMSTATFSAEEAEASPNHATPHYITLNGTLAQTGFDIRPTITGISAVRSRRMVKSQRHGRGELSDDHVGGRCGARWNTGRFWGKSCGDPGSAD